MKLEELEDLTPAHQDLYAMANAATEGLWIDDIGYRVRHPMHVNDGDRITDSKECGGSWGKDTAFIAFAKNNARYFVRYTYLVEKAIREGVDAVHNAQTSDLTKEDEIKAPLLASMNEIVLLSKWRDRMMDKVAAQEKIR